jgi:hypothetical protein
MLPGRLLAATAAACVFVVSLPGSASAQDSRLKLPTMAASAAAAADWATTYHALTNYRVREANPLLQPWRNSPGRLVVMGALMDVGVMSAWNLTVGRQHPRVAIAGLWAMSAFRSAIAIHNMRNSRKSPRR